MKISILSFLSIVTVFNQSLNGATFILGDYYTNDGSGANSGGTTASSEVETTGLYRADGGSGNPSGYQAIAVGAVYGGTIYRSVTTFDLTTLGLVTNATNAAPSGFKYVVDSMTITLEVSGGSTNLDQNGQPDPRPVTDIDFYEGDFASSGFSALPATANGSRTFNDPSGSFLNTTLTNLDLDLNTQTSFTFTMAASNANSGAFYTFGSGEGPNIGFFGTGYADKAPSMTVTYSIVPIPEPSVGLLALLGCSMGGLIYRRRPIA